jgi:hypothetical protein
VTAIKNGADPNATLQFRRKRGKTDARGTMDVVYEIEGVCTVTFAPAWARQSRKLNTEAVLGIAIWTSQVNRSEFWKSKRHLSGDEPSLRCSQVGVIHTHYLNLRRPT